MSFQWLAPKYIPCLLFVVVGLCLLFTNYDPPVTLSTILILLGVYAFVQRPRDVHLAERLARLEGEKTAAAPPTPPPTSPPS